MKIEIPLSVYEEMGGDKPFLSMTVRKKQLRIHGFVRAFVDTGSGNAKNVSATLEGSNPQTISLGFLNFTNQGNTSLKMLLWVDSALPSSMIMVGSRDGDPDTGSDNFPINNSEWAVGNSSVAVNDSEIIWLYANFTDNPAGVAVCNLWINSSQA